MKGKNKKMIYVLFAIYVILSATGLVLFKSGTNAHTLFTIFSIKISLKMLIGVFCYGFSFILWLFIVSQMNLTIAMPISVALVNTLVVIESVLILKEKITLIQGIGIVVVVTGVMLITGGTSAK